LVQQSRAGIVYARGGGGTVREIFQDAEENFYAPEVKDFTPMIFFDPDSYWERNGTTPADPAITIDDTLRNIMRTAHSRKTDVEPYLAKLAFTTSETQILDLLEQHSPRAMEKMVRMLA